jgi:hypothetical protein
VKNELPLFLGAPDGWDSARFWEIVLSFGTPLRGSPFPSLFLPSRQ